jgi:hypothetical protein
MGLQNCSIIRGTFYLGFLTLESGYTYHLNNNVEQKKLWENPPYFDCTGPPSSWSHGVCMR